MKFENTRVYNFERALYGMRNPMESYAKSDSHFESIEEYLKHESYDPIRRYIVGDNDMELAIKLIKAGTEHRKFLRQIFVSVDITAPLYWWKEFDTYKIGTTANSTSTMHKIASKPITLDCFEIDDYEPDIKCEQLVDYDYPQERKVYDGVEYVITMLEGLRQKYLETKDKKYWKELIRWLPESWLQTRTVTMTYENIRNMYFQRRGHKQNEWSGKDNFENENFVKWVESLPYTRNFIMYE